MTNDNNPVSKIAKMISEMGTEMVKINIPKIDIDIPKFDYNTESINRAAEEIGKVSQERIEREIQIAEGINSISRNQPIIANAVKILAQETQKESEYQRKVNLAIILLAAGSLIIAIVGIIIARLQ